MAIELRRGRFFDCDNGADLTDALAKHFRIREGRIQGGQNRSEAKQVAAQRNGLLGGRPRKQVLK